MKKYIISILALLLCVPATFAQTDSRNRVASTIIADGLAQLPAGNPQVFSQVISEMAATGEQGIQQLASSLNSYGKGEKNSVFEYALSGITDYASSNAGASCREGVKKGLAQAVKTCKNTYYKNFLLSLFGRLASAGDFDTLAGYTGDKDLSATALAAICSLHGVDAKALDFVKSAASGSNVPLASLAKIAEQFRLKGAEDLLLSRLSGADATTRDAIYSALSVIGSEKSLKALAAAAKAAGYAPEASHATDAYIRLLGNSDAAEALKGAKALAKSTVPAMRAAALELQLKSLGDKAGKQVIAALRDKDIQYRNTALDYARKYAGDKIFGEVAAAAPKLSAAARTDVVNWLGNNKVKAGESLIVSSVGSKDSTLSAAAIKAASKLGTPAALSAILPQLSTSQSAVATEALRSFPGQIADGIGTLLDGSKPASVLIPALTVAGDRHLHSLSGKVLALASSGNTDVRNAAAKALYGVASKGDYDAVAALLEKAGGDAAASLQKALCNAVSAETPEQQYARAEASIKKSSHPALYYPLLAQSGTPAALSALQAALNNNATSADAAKALMLVDNASVLPTLLSAAQQYPAVRNNMLTRMMEVAGNTVSNPVSKYQLLTAALATKPEGGTLSKIASQYATAPGAASLAELVSLMDNGACQYQAALAYKEILSHNAALNAGDKVLSGLKKAKDICQKRKDSANDADAGYAVDAINGLINTCAKGAGYDLNKGLITVEAGKRHTIADNQENIAFSFDWNAGGEGTVTLRSMPVVHFTASSVELIGSKKSIALPAACTPWHTMDVRLVDDRLFVTVDGTKFVENEVLKTAAGVASAKTTGAMAIAAGAAPLHIRNLNTALLANTPVSALTAEEKKQGFELLFDGHNLDKWQGNTVNYTPDNGTIYVTANYGGSGNLYTKKKYSDFIYRFEFSFVKPGVNNGIGIRTHIGTDAAYDGMEIQVLDHDDPIYADLHPYQQHGSVYGIIVPKHVKFGKLGTWNTEEIYAKGDHIRVTVNGEVILDGNIREACKGHNIAPDGGKSNPYTVDHQNHPGLFNKDGYVSFCGHGPGVRFRNVRILDLSKHKGK